MLNPRHRAGLGLALLSLAFATQASETPRVYVDGVAAVIADNYFDPARGRHIAADLRAAAAKGEFDALQDERELSTALSAWLDPLDTHFNVSWTPTQAAAAPTPGERPAQGAASDPQRRGNYGIRRVEILPGNVGYLDLRAFAGFEFGAPNQPARQAVEASLQLLSGAQTLIIDLRENGGGAPQMVGYLSSAFVRRDADIFNTFHGRDRTMSEAPLDWYPQPRLDTPLFLLTSGRTASAAEAFAYTLQSAKRAVVVGETSMGAANPGTEVDAGHGFSVFVSFASPINPITHSNWEGHGVTPDKPVAATDALNTARRLALEAVLASGRPGDDTTDARWALDALLAEAGPQRPIPVGDYVGNYGTLSLADDQGSLVLRQDRRPLRTLLPLGDDRFAIADDPSRRVIFARDGRGRVTALESMSSSGESTRYRRGG